ncbi:hypothetical protein E4H67_22390 [Escherichia coli]|nr:hypothetical protein [Escherichia coli]
MIFDCYGDADDFLDCFIMQPIFLAYIFELATPLSATSKRTCYILRHFFLSLPPFNLNIYP